ncbi:hypothetical protein L1275_001217 [Flavobacterium sp. HSC-61S13]|nr:hypothetical protein [Flavobacterium sp. HSC-61S13]
MFFLKFFKFNIYKELGVIYVVVLKVSTVFFGAA